MIKKYFITLTVIVFASFLGIQSTNAQTEKKVLEIEDAQLWRQHAVKLSDNGQWYTVLYSLSDKPEAKKDTIIDNLIEETAKKYYTDSNQTDVLYIYNAISGKKYEIKDGKRPVFSAASDWIAYLIKSDEKKKNTKDKKPKGIIELKHLESGYTVKYESDAEFSFAEEFNYFISNDKSSLLIYDLHNRREHYIGNIGEYVVDEKTESIAYTINSEDKRGNGIYLYNPQEMTTKSLITGNFLFSNLAWNKNRTALAAYKYNIEKEEVDYKKMSVLTISGIDTKSPRTVEYAVKDLKGFNKHIGLAIKSGRYSNAISWSNDDNRLFLKVKSYAKDSVNNTTKDEKDAATVQFWHWKDKKLLSQRMWEEERNKNKVFDAIFFLAKKEIKQISSKEIQRIIRSEGTDQWALGLDNREYISDWDYARYDLYRINLNTGAQNLIAKKQLGGFEMSPSGDKFIVWDGAHYWCYNLTDNSKINISANASVSFIDEDDDHFGPRPDYGFVGWVKGNKSVVVNHKNDLWVLSVNGNDLTQNLTAAKSNIRYRFDDRSFRWETEIEDRFIDLKSSIILSAFNRDTKENGFYSLKNGKLNQLIYGQMSLAASRWRSGLTKAEHSDAIIYKKGDYQNYTETYLSNTEFENPQKITNTNPQQEAYAWGHRILIEYTNDDGVPLQAVLSIPDTYQKGEKLPMLVYSYEKLSQGLYSYVSPYLSGASMTEMLYVSDGYLFLRPDIHFNVGTPHSDMHECLDAAIEKVIELGYVDANKIGYEGFSYGGHTGMYVSTQDNKFAAIAAGAGVSNLVQGFNLDIVRDGSNEQDYYMVSQGRLGTDPTSNTEMYLSESAVFNAQNMNTPLLLFHGTADKVVLWEHSFGFYSILRYLKKPVVFLSYQGEGHGLRKRSNRLDIQMRLKEYFDHYLKGEEADKWILEELPYVPKKESKDDKKNKRTYPDWM